VIVSQQHKVVLLDGAHLARIQSVIPHAQAFKQYAVVPHRLEETRLLRNLGIATPAPIEYHYKWPGRHKPMDHQRSTAAFLTMNRRAFVLNGLGTGKTLSAYWATDYLMREQLVRRVLVISPLSTLERVHGDTIFNNFPLRSFCVLHGSAERRRRLLESDFDFYITNFEGVSVLRHALAARLDIDLVLIDECASYRNAGTTRWAHLKKLIRPEQWVWGMTATPTPNEPPDAYAQVRLINPARLEHYPSFRSFQMATMRKVSLFKWEPKPEAIQTVHSIMQPAVRYAREDCLDLPECTYETRTVDLTPAQKKAYKDLLNEYVTEVRSAQITALNEAVKLMRLVQVVSGTVYDVAGQHHNIDCAPRLNVVKEIIEEAGTKVIVFVPFVGNINFLREALGKVASVEVVYGDTSPAERNRIFQDFQMQEHPRVLVAHPATMSHGLTLTAASTIVWWAPINSNETYSQANGRINRIGARNAMTVFHLAGTKVEGEMYKRLENRQKLQGLLLDAVKSTT
jgi:SNF2 family DNA or RNA helicase